MDFERCFRLLRQTANYMWEQPDYSVANDDTRTIHYAFCQGSCAFEKDGEILTAFLFIPNDGSKFCEGGNSYTGNGLLSIKRLDGSHVKEKVISSYVGHGNALAYHEGYFYFSGGQPESVHDELASHKIRRFPYDWNDNSTVESYLMPYEING